MKASKVCFSFPAAFKYSDNKYFEQLYVASNVKAGGTYTKLLRQTPLYLQNTMFAYVRVLVCVMVLEVSTK